MIYAGIDWGSTHHYVVVLSEDGAVLHKGRVAHSVPALEELKAKLAEFEPCAQNVQVVFEMHVGGLLAWLQTQDYRLFTIVPKSSDRARDVFRPSGGKDDRGDARTMANLLRLGADCLRELEPRRERTQVLLQWLGMRERLVQQRVATLHQMRAVLTEFSPELSKACGNLKCVWPRKLLAAYPSQHSLQQARWEDIAPICGRCREATVKRLKTACTTPAMPVPDDVRRHLEQKMLLLLEDLELMTERIEKIEAELERLIADHPRKHLAESLPVKGIVTRATALAIMEEASTLKWEEKAAQWGVAPVTKQSGNYEQVCRRIACDHHICQFLIQFAFNTIRFEGSWAHEYYYSKRPKQDKDGKCKRDKKHYSTLRCLAKKWVKILDAMWRHDTEYDEQYHQENRRRRAA